MRRRGTDPASDLSDLTPDERCAALGAAAGMLADAAYENVVLSAWCAVHDGRDDPFVRDLMRRPDWRQVISGPYDDQVVLEAILTAARTRERPDQPLTHDAVERQLRWDEQRRRGMDEDYDGLRSFDGYVDRLVERRGGRPPSDMAYWLQTYNRAARLHELVRAGVHVDAGIPDELRHGPGRHALAVQRSQVALDREHHRRRAAANQLRAGLQELGFTWATTGVFGAASAAAAPLDLGVSGALGAPALIFLVGSIAKSVQAVRGRVQRGVIERRIGRLESALDTQREELRSSFGPMLRQRPAGPRR